MKKNPLLKALILSLVAASTCVAQDTTAAAPAAAAPAAAPAPAYTEEQLLEEFGWYVGQKSGLAQLQLSPGEADTLGKGIQMALNGKDSPYELQKIGPAMSEFMQKKQNAILDRLRLKNLSEGTAFFEKLRENKAVIEERDGLRYEIQAPGVGEPPKPTDTVKVNYTGHLIDGTVFDSSERQGKPVEFPLNKVISGWTEGLQKISKGGKMKLYIPPQLAYGDEGRPGIPPGATLVFDIELVDVTPAAAASAAIVPPPAVK
ncbi:MAG TPA: FKBP-type peptidyl-prolyl cis-trans isomerase [Opitutaceae bacterium]